MSRVFGMITTKGTWGYTQLALESLTRTVLPGIEDRVVLVDNDSGRFPPLGFGPNVNRIMSVAAERQADLIMLNNDIVLTPGWLEGLGNKQDTVTSPVSNFQVPYRPLLPLFLEISDYVGREREFASVFRAHRKHVKPRNVPMPAVPFFAVRIPYRVYSCVGKLADLGGSEDHDYCLRCWLAGFRVEYAIGSYVLHFGSRSGGCTPDSETRLRDEWGEVICDLLKGKCNMLATRENAPIRAALEREDFASAVLAMMGV